VTDASGYADWRAVEQATKDAAKRARAAAGSDGLTLEQHLLQARFDRFLCRVFDGDGADGRWLLKGGTALLARVPNARGTRDVDLSSNATTLDEAVKDLAARVGVALGDHLRFELARSRPTGGGDTQPFVQAQTVTFATWAGAKKVGDVSVDVVVGHPPTGRPRLLEPATRIVLSRPLPTVPYLVYPIADQIADKVCATMTTGFREGARSTRVKDLIDLVVIACTQTVNLHELRVALASERRRRGIHHFDQLDIPAHWRDGYALLEAKTAAIDVDFDAAHLLMERFLAPALAAGSGESDRRWTATTWFPELGADRPANGWT
jgi:hypothetical protein